jgi:hypothetical protein
MSYDSVGTLELLQILISNLQGRFVIVLIQLILSFFFEGLFLSHTCFPY